jgi:acylglycerol lipase
MFTANHEYLDYIEKDPLRLQAATSKFYFENFLLSLKAAMVARCIDLPVLLIQSGNDQIVDTKRVMRWFARVPDGRKTMREFPQALHSIDFESLLFRDYTALMVEWISKLAVPA